ncbi:hypothetical protein JD844_033841 [Phrynosoma platyrhinos]|uniref:Borealin n=1 Tax=Phrynosoma platyrhinos TaxID=52577 RepID=A0ABQ7T6V5_PHRPL|nr:hypothetical protein JD844_033841 [Phrynosoma platyrhinos]
MASPKQQGSSSQCFLSAYPHGLFCFLSVKERIQAIKVSSEHLQKEISNIYDMELLRLPVALREMNWLSYYALGGGEKALEKVALGDLDIQEITKLASEAIQTPIKTVRKAKKAKQAIETIDEEVGSPVLPSGKRSRQEKEAVLPGPSEQDSNMLQQPRKGKRSIKKPLTAKKSRPPSVRSTRFSRRTPGLRPPAPQERVFSISISANGSPLADSNDIFITLPVGGGEPNNAALGLIAVILFSAQSICMRASDLTEKDLKRLNPTALGSMRKLSVSQSFLCFACVDLLPPNPEVNLSLRRFISLVSYSVGRTIR